MPITSLVIGLGGTGQWVTLYVKKELLETHGNALPDAVKIIAFDTVSESTYSVGGHGEARQTGGRTIGQVRLEPGEYVHAVGDNTAIKNFVTEIANGQHPHLSSWFQAAWYKQNLPDALFDLAEGAGMFRQFGRLAVFNDVRAPARSRIHNILKDAIGGLKTATNDTELQVFLVGSLAGGTGAGMFADIAHMVRQIALQPNIKMQPTVRGYLVLPDAFTRTVSDTSLLASMRARAYAAMRENRRFSASFDWKRGYPMEYNTLSEGFWRGRIHGKLFDYLYYLDGQRRNNSLTQHAMEQGVAPTIADAVTAILDGKAGAKFKEYTLNVSAEYTARIARGALNPETSVVGSVGTFTIVFPIYHLVEGWSYRLAHETLKDFLAPARLDSKTGVPIALARNANPENLNAAGRDEARDFLSGNKPITNPFDPNESVEPTLIWGELSQIATSYQSSKPTTVEMLAARTLDGWNRIFEPAGADPTTQQLIARTKAVLKARLRDEVRASADRKPKGDPANDLSDIESKTKAFKNTHLGVEDQGTGQRRGGQYATTLNQYVEYHAERYRIALDLQIRITLNGRTAEASQAKAGKLGYLIDLLEGIVETLDLARLAMNDVAQIRSQQGQARKTAIAAAATALHEMRARAKDKIPVVGTPSLAAFDTQVRYLDAEQRVLDILQSEAMERAVLQTIVLMIDYTKSALASANAWAKTLALDPAKGLYAEVLRGLNQVKAERLEDAQIPVRMVRPKAAPNPTATVAKPDLDYEADAKYEESRYRHYLRAGGHNWREEILDSLQWNTVAELVDNQPKVSLKLSIVRPGGAAPVQANPTPTVGNLERMISACRQAFEAARETESVMAYLQAVYPDANTLARIIHDRSGVLLDNQGNPLLANYLRVSHSADDPGQADYIRGMLQYLGNQSSTAAAGAGGQVNYAQQVDSEDRFKCSLIHTEELIALDTLAAFNTAKKDYTSYSGDKKLRAANRRILHVFPAEVNAVGYEDRLRELNQNPRQFSDKVTLQLERKDDLRDFLMCWIYELIGVKTYDEGGVTYSVWRLALPTGDGEEEEWYLTKPVAGEPSLMEAIATYNYVGADVGHGDEYAKEINYTAVKEVLAWTRDRDVEQRLEESRAGENAPASLLASIDNLPPEVKRDALADLARRAPLIPFQKTIREDLLPEWQAALANEPDLQESIDLACVFWLMLDDEAAQLKESAERRVRAVPGAMPVQSVKDAPGVKKPRAGFGSLSSAGKGKSPTATVKPEKKLAASPSRAKKAQDKKKRK